MFLIRYALVLLLGFSSIPSLAQAPGSDAGTSAAKQDEESTAPESFLARGRIDMDILFNYYTQDGDRSPVTGGEGTEELDVITPVVLLNWRVGDNWQLRADLGLDAITSASTDNIDDNVSSASEVDNRAHAVITALRTSGPQTIGFTAGFSTEYDYNSITTGLQWSRSFRDESSTLAASLFHFSDTVELYDIDGIVQGEDDRTTTDFSISWTQVFSPRAVGSVELYLSSQSGFLSTPFHEVILAPTPGETEGLRVTERLPDSRRRTALGLRYNYSFSKKVVQRSYIRTYDDDWGLTAQTLELETHFRLPTRNPAWIYPILRFHTQSGIDYFGAPRTFSAEDEFFTADGDLGEFDSQKFGLGYRISFQTPRKGWLKRLRGFDTRVTSYSRDDGLDAISASLALSWRF